jgi:hypothetical protein
MACFGRNMVVLQKRELAHYRCAQYWANAANFNAVLARGEETNAQGSMLATAVSLTPCRPQTGHKQAGGPYIGAIALRDRSSITRFHAALTPDRNAE